MSVETLDRRNHLVLSPAPLESADDAATEDHFDAVADDELVEIVGHDENGHASLLRPFDDLEERTFGGDVDALSRSG